MKKSFLLVSLMLSATSPTVALGQTRVKPDTAAPTKTLPYQFFPMQDPKTGRAINPEEKLRLGI